MNEKFLPGLEEELDRFRARYNQLQQQISDSRNQLDWFTQNEVVLEHDSMCLRRFAGANGHAPLQSTPPLLIVYSHVNQPCIIDMQQNHSLVQCLMKCGHPVYLLDWGKVSEADNENDLSVYVDKYLDIAVTYLIEQTGHNGINLLGICQGGTFALCYGCLHPQKVNRLATLVTPIDFHRGDGLLTHWVRHIDFSLLDHTPQNIPGALITLLFQLMRPFEDLSRQVRLIEQATESRNLDFVMKMDQWVYNCPDQPGRAFAQFMQRFYRDNALAEGKLVIADRSIELSRLTMPLLNVYARHDHLVPPASSRALRQFVSSDNYQELEFCGGHIGLLVSEKAQQTTLPMVADWLSGL